MPAYPRIVAFPDPKLRRAALKLDGATFGTSALRDYCQVLANLLVAAERADVIAGTQIDFDPAWQVLAVQAMNSEVSGVSILCNPVIRDESGGAVEFERSVSFACVPVQLSAPSKLVVEYRKPDGSRRKIECARSGARAVFQGVESLRGKILLDRMMAAGAHHFVRRYKEAIEERDAPEIFLPDRSLVVPN